MTSNVISTFKVLIMMTNLKQRTSNNNDRIYVPLHILCRHYHVSRLNVALEAAPLPLVALVIIPVVPTFPSTCYAPIWFPVSVPQCCNNPIFLHCVFTSISTPTYHHSTPHKIVVYRHPWFLLPSHHQLPVCGPFWQMRVLLWFYIVHRCCGRRRLVHLAGFPPIKKEWCKWYPCLLGNFHIFRSIWNHLHIVSM